MPERVAIVTGTGRGLGRVMATALLSAGHRVFLTSRDTESLEEMRRASGAAERAAIGTADLSNENELRGMVDEAVRAFGRIEHPGQQRRDPQPTGTAAAEHCIRSAAPSVRN